MTLSHLAADAVLLLHTCFIAFVVLGLFVIWLGFFVGWSWTRNLVFRLAHLAAIGLVVIQSYLRITCPLTDLENRLRIAAGQDPYGDGGFIAHYLHRVIFFSAPSWVFTLVYTAFALLVIGTLILAPPRRHRPQPTLVPA
jgi:hypothetical protein